MNIPLNNVSTKITSALTSIATSVTVTAGDGALFAGASGGNTIRATLIKRSGFQEYDWEIIDITSRTTDTLTITRAMEGTTALAFAVGDVLEVRHTAGTVAQAGVNADITSLEALTSATISNSTATLPTPETGTMLHLGNVNGTATIQQLDAFGAGNFVTFRRSQGTNSAPAALQANNIIGGFRVSGYGATAYGVALNSITVIANENWTDTAQGRYIRFYVVKDGTTTNLPSMDLRNNGVVYAHRGFGSAIASVTTSTYTVLDTDSSLIINYAGTCTLTLPSAATYASKTMRVKTVTNNTVVSASSDVVPLVGGAAGTAILAAAAGKWADLQSDGTNWVIMAGN